MLIDSKIDFTMYVYITNFLCRKIFFRVFICFCFNIFILFLHFLTSTQWETLLQSLNIISMQTYFFLILYIITHCIFHYFFWFQVSGDVLWYVPLEYVQINLLATKMLEGILMSKNLLKTLVVRYVNSPES